MHYLLLFTLRNRLQLSVLATQLFCHKTKSKNFVAVYDAVMKEDPFSPLIIDLSPKTPSSTFMLRKDVSNYFRITVANIWYRPPNYSMIYMAVNLWLVSIMSVSCVDNRHITWVTAMNRISPHVYYLRYLSVATCYQRRHLLQTATSEQLNVLYEIIFNVLQENIPLSDDDYSKLYRHKTVLRKLALKEIDPYTKKELISKHSRQSRIC